MMMMIYVRGKPPNAQSVVGERHAIFKQGSGLLTGPFSVSFLLSQLGLSEKFADARLNGGQGGGSGEVGMGARKG